MSLYDSLLSKSLTGLTPESPYQRMRRELLQRQPVASPPEVDDSLLRQAGGAVLGGASWIGSELDKLFGARALRGALAGNPREILSAIPGSDLVGLTDPSQSVSGRDVLETWGVLGQNKPGFDAGDVAGFAAEVVLDPATYLTLGASAVGKAGKAAKLAGVLPKTRLGRVTTTLADVAAANPNKAGDLASAIGGAGEFAARQGEKLGGLVGVGLPFRDPIVTMGTGALSQKIAGGLDRLQDAARFSAPGRTLAAMFQAENQGIIPKEGQLAAQQAFRNTELGTRGKLGVAGQAFYNLQDAGVLNDPGHVARFRRALEGLDSPGLHPVEKQVADTLRAQYAGDIADLEALGLPAKELNDKFIDFAHRQFTQPDVPSGASMWSSKVFGTTHKGMKKRERFLSDIPEGTDAVNRIVTEYGATAKQAIAAKDGKALSKMAVDLAKKHLGLTDDELAEVKALKQTIQEHQTLTPGVVSSAATDVTKLEAARTGVQAAAGGAIPDLADNAAEQVSRFADPTAQAADLAQKQQMAEWSGLAADVAQAKLSAIRAKVKQAKKLLNWSSSLDDAHHAHGVFQNHGLSDFMSYGAMNERVKANANAIHDMFSKNATAGMVDESSTSLFSAMKTAKLIGPAGIARQAAPLMGVDAADILADPKLLKQAKQTLKNTAIPKDVADSAARLMDTQSVPAAVQEVLGISDKLTQWFKAGVTTPFPGFHARNFGTGVWMNFVAGALGKKSYFQTRDLLGGDQAVKGFQSIPDLAGMSDAEATRALSLEVMQNRIADITSVTDVPDLTDKGIQVATAAKTQIDRLRSRFPGANPDSLKDIAKSYIPRTLAQADPRKIAGVGANVDIFAPVAAGRRLGNMTEQLNRVAGYVELRKQGYTPEVAAAKIRAAHVDYKLLSPFEKSVMRRVIPFWAFSRAMVPHTIAELAQKPGGKVAQAIRFQNSQRDQQGFTPDYIGGGLAIPLGGEEGGIQRYLTQFDLPHEILNDLVQVGPGGAEQTGLSALGQVNPLLKGPLELATGKQFFSGRELRDLDPRTGRLLNQAGVLDDPRSSKLVNAADQVIMNSPLSRIVSTVGQLADTRKSVKDKAINLLTGVRISQVDMDKQREIEARNMLENLLRGRPGVSVNESLYIPKDERANLDPETAQLMQALQAIQKRAQQRRRAKEKAA